MSSYAASSRYDDPYAAQQDADEDYTSSGLPVDPPARPRSSRSKGRPARVESESENSEDEDKALQDEMWNDEEAAGAVEVQAKSWIQRTFRGGGRADPDQATPYVPVIEPKDDFIANTRSPNLPGFQPRPLRTSPPAPPPAPRRKSRLAWYIGGGIAILLVVAAIGFAVYRLLTKNKDTGRSSNDSGLYSVNNTTPYIEPSVMSAYGADGNLGAIVGSSSGSISTATSQSTNSLSSTSLTTGTFSGSTSASPSSSSSVTRSTTTLSTRTVPPSFSAKVGVPLTGVQGNTAAVGSYGAATSATSAPSPPSPPAPSPPQLTGVQANSAAMSAYGAGGPAPTPVAPRPSPPQLTGVQANSDAMGAYGAAPAPSSPPPAPSPPQLTGVQANSDAMGAYGAAGPSKSGPVPIGSFSSRPMGPGPVSRPPLPVPSVIAPAPGGYPWQSKGGLATWYESDHHQTGCGFSPSDTDFVVNLPTALYRAASGWVTQGRSSFCGVQVTITNIGNGKAVNAWVADECIQCTSGGDIDLSKAAFKSISDGTMSLGILQVVWGFTASNPLPLGVAGSPPSGLVLSNFVPQFGSK